MKLAIVFPGQGSQSIGMLQDVATQYTEVTRTFSEASSVLGYDLWELVINGPKEKLDQTTYTQPALLAAGVAVYRIMHARLPLDIAYFAGHSLGEYTALVCANALSFHDAVKLVEARGQFMQEAVPADVGAMAAIIGLEQDIVEGLCKKHTDSHHVASIANINSIGQIVIAGHKATVHQVMQAAKEQGAKMVVLLPVSVPSHCELMQVAADRLAKILAETSITTTTIPVINNVDVQIYESPLHIIDGLSRQLCHPVRWVETVQYMVNDGVTKVIECGPGKVLTGLNKRIDKNLELVSTADLESIERLLS